MTLLVRDEEDIITANLEFHLAQGVDHFIITDNLSVDRTPDLIAPWVARGIATYRTETRDDYSQHEWVTHMARLAATDHAADWVINNDADEFWMAVDESITLKDALAALPPSTRAVAVPRYNCPPLSAQSDLPFASEMVYRERQSFNLQGETLQPKVCHRAMADIVVAQGNHAVSRNSVELQAEAGPLEILHYPLRSYRQFENKIVKGGAAYARNRDLPGEIGAAWRELHEAWLHAGNLVSQYLSNVPTEDELAARLASGELVRDDRVARALAQRLR